MPQMIMDDPDDQVPSGGGLVIQGPLGFEFPNPCQPEAGWVDFWRKNMKETMKGELKNEETLREIGVDTWLIFCWPSCFWSFQIFLTLA